MQLNVPPDLKRWSTNAFPAALIRTPRKVGPTERRALSAHI